MKIAIAAPLRNVAWVLPRYLAHLDVLEFDPEHLYYIFLINDCQDETEAILAEWARTKTETETETETKTKTKTKTKIWKRGQEQKQRQERVTILHRDFGYPWWRRDQGRGYSKENLAIMRNLIRETFLASECDYLFSVDSDTLVPPGILKKLLAARKDWIGPLVVAHPQGPIYNIMLWDAASRSFSRQGIAALLSSELKLNRPFKVGVLGGCCLYSRRLLEQCQFRFHPWGEHLGLAQEALAKGFSIWCDPDPQIRPEHLLNISDDTDS